MSWPSITSVSATPGESWTNKDLSTSTGSGAIDNRVFFMGYHLYQITKLAIRARPYSRSEVIHRAGDESLFPAFERERPRIVNNFAASASSGYEFSSISEKMNSTRLSNLAVVLGSGNEYSDEDESSLETITSGYKEFASGSGRANNHYPPSRI